MSAAASLTTRDSWAPGAGCAHLLLYHAPQLLLRLLVAQAAHSPDTSDQNSTFAALLLARLGLARRVGWTALTDAYATDLATNSQHQQRQHRQQAEGVDARKAQPAAARARVGALRSAVDILVGGPPAPPSPAVAGMIRDRFIAAPRAAEHELLLEAIDSSRAMAPGAICHPRLRDIGHQVARAKAAAGPGPRRMEELAYRVHLRVRLRHTCAPHVGDRMGPRRDTAVGGCHMVGSARETLLENDRAAHRETDHAHRCPRNILLRHRCHSC